MKLLTVQYGGETIIGALVGEHVIDLQKSSEMVQCTFPYATLLEGIEAGDIFTQHVTQLLKEVENKGGVAYPLQDVTFLAPIPKWKKNMMCVGKNYALHAIELGSKDDIPEHIMMFTKAPTAVNAHNAVVPLHANVTNMLDYEGELAVIIGKTVRNVSEEEAMDVVFGYTIVNDVTARDLQQRHKQFFIGKSLDGTAPMGPVIVTKDEIKDPHHLSIQTKVNGEIRQDANTEQFIFSIPTIISTLSKGMTLEPGDIIATGTPAGVGKGMNPPVFLQEGDVIEVTIEGIGTLRNEVK